MKVNHINRCLKLAAYRKARIEDSLFKLKALLSIHEKELEVINHKIKTYENIINYNQ